MSLVHLTRRGLIGIGGPDSLRFLQPLVSQDLKLLKTINLKLSRCRSAAPCLFMRPTARIQFESLIIDSSNHENPLFNKFDYLVDHNVLLTESLLQLLQKRKLRSDVTIEDLTSEIRTAQIVSNKFPSIQNSSGFSPLSELTKAGLLFCDSRWPLLLGYRFIYDKNGTCTRQKCDINFLEEDDYNEQRLSKGIIEPDDFLTMFTDQQWNGSSASSFILQSLSSHLPFNLNYDLLGYLNTKKGCYVGQETINRSLSLLVLRRRLLVIKTEKPLHKNTELSLIFEHNAFVKRSIGQVVAHRGHYLLCCFNLREFQPWLREQGIDIDSLKEPHNLVRLADSLLDVPIAVMSTTKHQDKETIELTVGRVQPFIIPQPVEEVMAH